MALRQFDVDDWLLAFAGSATPAAGDNPVYVGSGVNMAWQHPLQWGTGLLLDGTTRIVSIDPATTSQATAGTDNAHPITAAVLKLGALPSSLATTAKTLIPAINEVSGVAGAALQRSGGQMTGALAIGGAAQGASLLTVRGQVFQTETNTNPSTDFYHWTLSNAVSYTTTGTQGDTIGMVSQLSVLANGQTITQSNHTAAVYGVTSLGPDGNAAGVVTNICGLMAATGVQGPATLNRGVDFYAHSPFKTGGGRFIDHYAFYQECVPTAEHEYGAFFAGNLGIGADQPQYCLTIVPGVNNASGTNWMNVGSGNGTLIMTNAGCYLYPGYNPGAGGFGATDFIVGFNGQANATNSTQYFMYLSSCAGVPTGVPAQAGAGVAVVIDSTNFKFDAYVGGAWKGITLSANDDVYAKLGAASTAFTGNLSAAFTTFSGTTFDAPSGGSLLVFKTNAGTAKMTNYLSGVSLRWTEGVITGAESGSNAGSNWALVGYSDTQTLLGTWFAVTRSSGAVSMPGVVTVGSLTTTGAITPATLTTTGAIKSGGALSIPTVASVATTTYTVAAGDVAINLTGAATCTLTLPAASANTGRILKLKTAVAFTAVSASSNVVPAASVTAGTAILAATAGKWCELISDGTNWQTMAQG